jgi:hypothetical protein
LERSASGLNAIINVEIIGCAELSLYLSTLTTPTLTTTAASALQQPQGGSISSDGGATVTARGIAA